MGFLGQRASSLIMSFALLGIAALGHFTYQQRYTAVQPATANNGAPASGLRFEGVELELIGLIWFVALIALELASRHKADAEPRFRSYIFFASTAALAGLLWVALDVGFSIALPIQYWVAAASAIALFVLSSMTIHAPVRQVVRSFPSDMGLLLRRSTTWMAVAVGTLLVATRPAIAGRGTGPMGEEFVAWFVAQPRQKFPADIGSAPVTIVKFNDYQCAACASAESYYGPLFAELSERYPGGIVRISYDFPLEAECNAAGFTLHLGACEAAAAAKLAKRIGRGPMMEEWLWQNQRTLTRETVFDAAKRLGVTGLHAAYPSLLEEVRAEAQIGKDLGVSGTPTFYVNGVVMTMVPRENLRAVLLHELEQQASNPSR